MFITGQGGACSPCAGRARARQYWLQPRRISRPSAPDARDGARVCRCVCGVLLSIKAYVGCRAVSEERTRETLEMAKSVPIRPIEGLDDAWCRPLRALLSHSLRNMTPRPTRLLLKVSAYVLFVNGRSRTSV